MSVNPFTHRSIFGSHIVRMTSMPQKLVTSCILSQMKINLTPKAKRDQTKNSLLRNLDSPWPAQTQYWKGSMS
jgi:predicted flavoprotein YhiN